MIYSRLFGRSHWWFAVTFVCVCVAAFCAKAAEAPARKYVNVERLALPRLKAVHEDVERFKAQRVEMPARAGLNDYRCIFHAHAEDSAHTGGTLEEMLADAKKAKVSAIFLADHFRPPRDFIDGRWRGLREGVLFIPGSEIRGFLIHPMASILNQMEQPEDDFIKTVGAGEGMIFLSHIEERPERSLEGLTGLEIYNRHWDAKKDMASLLAVGLKLTDPKELADLQEAVKLYPDELLGFQCDYPKEYLTKWDAGTASGRFTGVAANDCHHNQIFVVKMVDEETVILGTNVDPDEKMQKVKAVARPGIRELTKGHQPGEVLARVDLDPYARSFWNVCTHVLALRLDEATMRAAVKAGRVYVSHDWMCDATGFDFAVNGGDSERRGMMGDEVKFTNGLRLTVKLPASAYVRFLRNGNELLAKEGKELELDTKEPGAYRVEAWLKLDGELRPWIYSNPIYVR